MIARQRQDMADARHPVCLFYFFCQSASPPRCHCLHHGTLVRMILPAKSILFRWNSRKPLVQPPLQFRRSLVLPIIILIDFILPFFPISFQSLAMTSARQDESEQKEGKRSQYIKDVWLILVRLSAQQTIINNVETDADTRSYNQPFQGRHPSSFHRAQVASADTEKKGNEQRK